MKINDTCDIVDLLIEGMPEFSKLTDILEAAVDKAHEKYLDGLEQKLYDQIEKHLPSILRKNVSVLGSNGGIDVYLSDNGAEFPSIRRFTADELIEEAFNEDYDSSHIRAFMDKLQIKLDIALKQEQV